MTFSDITEKDFVKESHSSLESENSTCATVHSHLCNSWALVSTCCGNLSKWL